MQLKTALASGVWHPLNVPRGVLAGVLNLILPVLCSPAAGSTRSVQSPRLLAGGFTKKHTFSRYFYAGDVQVPSAERISVPPPG